MRGSRIDCFVTTGLSRLGQITYDGASWGAWADRGGAISGRPSCTAGAGSALDCYASGLDGTLYRFAFNGVSWAAPQRLGGGSVTRPECVARAGGVDCLTVDRSRNLLSVRISGGRAGAFARRLAGVALPPHCLASGRVLDCFAQGAGQSLRKGYFNGTRWQAWTNAGGTSVFTQPWCNRISSGFECYWTTTSNRLVRRARTGSAWGAEADLGGAVQQRPVCLARNGGARVDCLARGLDNTLRQTSYF